MRRHLYQRPTRWRSDAEFRSLSKRERRGLFAARAQAKREDRALRSFHNIVELRGRRLKGLDEFEAPEFVGRMARVRRRRTLMWWGMLAIAVIVGATIGLTI